MYIFLYIYWPQALETLGAHVAPGRLGTGSSIADPSTFRQKLIIPSGIINLFGQQFNSGHFERKYLTFFPNNTASDTQVVFSKQWSGEASL